MRKSKKVNEVTTQPSGKGEVATVSGPLKLVLFTAGGGANVHIPQNYLPSSFQGEKMKTGSFRPMADWVKAGECVGGTFQRIRQDVGPNNSNIFELVVDVPELLGGKKPFEGAFWGSTQLDDLFMTHEPPILEGDRILVTYIGVKPTKRGLNPVKLFTLIVIPKGRR